MCSKVMYFVYYTIQLFTKITVIYLYFSLSLITPKSEPNLSIFFKKIENTLIEIICLCK